VSAELGVALPFWLDRPDEEAVEIALAADRAALYAATAVTRAPSQVHSSPST
jgi:hypothetical protein